MLKIDYLQKSRVITYLGVIGLGKLICQACGTCAQGARSPDHGAHAQRRHDSSWKAPAALYQHFAICGDQM